MFMENMKANAFDKNRCPLNIWIISFFFPPDFGGSSSRSWNFAKSLQAKGHKIGVISSFPQYPYGKILDKRYKRKFLVIEEIEGIKVARFRLPPLPHRGFLNRMILFTYFLLLSVILKPYFRRFVGSPNLIYSHTPVIFSALIGYVYAKREKVPLAVDCHDLWPDVLNIMKSPLQSSLQFIGRALGHFSFHKADVITIWGVEASKALSKIYNIPKERIHAVYTGVDTFFFKPLNKGVALDSLMEQSSNQEILKKFIVLYSGAINRYYNFDLFINVAEKLNNSDKVLFWVSGEGEEKERIVKICESKGLGNIQFCPYLPNQKMVSFRINLADLCIIPLRQDINSSVFDPYILELPTKFFEYTSCGKPVLCIGQCEASNLIKEWNAGVVEDFGDVNNMAKIILNLSKNGVGIKVMGENARTLAEELFSLKKTGEKLDNILCEMINSRPKNYI